MLSLVFSSHLFCLWAGLARFSCAVLASLVG